MKQSSRSVLAAFTILAVALAVAPAVAHADRVVLYPVSGRADPERLGEIEDRIAEVVREVGHEVLAPPGGLGSADRPDTSAEMGGVATASGATYVVVAEIEPLRGQYRLHVRVGYQPTQRVEELVVTVLDSEERARLLDVLRAMLRPDGLGDDAMRLTGGGEDVPPPDDAERLRREEEERARLASEEAEEEAERRRREEEEAARAAEEAQRAEEEARRAEEERAQREREAWNARPVYGRDGAWLVMLGVEGSYAAGFSPRTVDVVIDGTTTTRTFGAGGGLGIIQARVGYAFEGTDGLELRGGIDVELGSFGALGIVVGGAWQFTPSTLPIHVGFTLELGPNFLFSGARDVGFLVRGGAIASWTPLEHLQIELALPEIGVITNGSGAFVVGAALRAGYRF